MGILKLRVYKKKHDKKIKTIVVRNNYRLSDRYNKEENFQKSLKKIFS